MIKVLVFDDRKTTRYTICSELNHIFSNDIEITACYDIFEANDAIEKNKYDVIIVDCMMGTFGLNSEQTKQAVEGLLTGPIWLCSVHNSNPTKLENTQIFVFSGYIEAVDEHMDALNEYTHNDNFFINNVTLVSKSNDAIDTIIKAIKEKIRNS